MAAAQLLLFHSPVERWSGFVRLVLEEKELEYDTNTVNSLVCENRQPWYLKELNENGDLPTLVYKNKIISSAVYIARFLDKQFRSPPLVPTDERQAAQVDAWIQKAAEIPDPALCRPVESKMRGWLARETLEAKSDLMDRLAEENEDLREKYDVWADEYGADADIMDDQGAQQEVRDRIEARLDEAEEALRHGQYLVGSAYTLADAAWTAVAQDLELNHLQSMWEAGRRRAFAKWYRRMKARPSFDGAYGEHPLTLDMLLSLWGLLGSHLLRRMNWRAVVGVGIAAMLARRWVSSGPGPNAPIMITF